MKAWIKKSSQIRATSPEQPARSLHAHRATAPVATLSLDQALRWPPQPFLSSHQGTKENQRHPEAFFLVIFTFYVTAISTTPLVLPVGTGPAEIPPCADTPAPAGPGPRSPAPGLDTRGCTTPEGPQTPPARSWQPHRPEAALEQPVAPSRPPQPQQQPRRALTLHHLLRPRSALRRHNAPPPTAPSGNRLHRRRGQSEPAVTAAPQPITRSCRAQEEGQSPPTAQRPQGLSGVVVLCRRGGSLLSLRRHLLPLHRRLPPDALRAAFGLVLPPTNLWEEQLPPC